MLLIIAGTSLFLMARNGLASIANGTPHACRHALVRPAPTTLSAQSSLGLMLIELAWR
jgi:hypothetical protein